MTNGTDPDQLSPDERLDEVAMLLAGALMRLRTRKSSHLSPDAGESSLDFLANQRGHPTPADRSTVDG
jgi:hypothetical protein